MLASMECYDCSERPDIETTSRTQRLNGNDRADRRLNLPTDGSSALGIASIMQQASAADNAPCRSYRRQMTAVQITSVSYRKCAFRL